MVNQCRSVNLWEQHAKGCFIGWLWCLFVVERICINVERNILVGVYHKDIPSQDSFNDFKCIPFQVSSKRSFYQICQRVHLANVPAKATRAGMCWQHQGNCKFLWCFVAVLGQEWQKCISTMAWGQLASPNIQANWFLEWPMHNWGG